jgi:hypothetical protein
MIVPAWAVAAINDVAASALTIVSIFTVLDIGHSLDS